MVKAIAGTLTNWSCFAAITIHDFGSIVNIIVGIVGIVAGCWAIAVSRETLKARSIEALMAENELCARCRAGFTPVSCPFPPSHQPKNCPLKKAT